MSNTRSRKENQRHMAEQRRQEQIQREMSIKRIKRRALIIAPVAAAVIAAGAFAAVSTTGPTTKPATHFKNLVYFAAANFGGNPSSITADVQAVPEQMSKGEVPIKTSLLDCYTGTAWAQIGLLLVDDTAAKVGNVTEQISGYRLVTEVFNSTGVQIYPTNHLGDLASLFPVSYGSNVQLSITVANGSITTNASVLGAAESFGTTVADSGATACISDINNTNRIGEASNVEEEIHQSNGPAQLENPITFKIVSAGISTNEVVIQKDGLTGQHSDFGISRRRDIFTGSSGSVTAYNLNASYDAGVFTVREIAAGKRE